MLLTILHIVLFVAVVVLICVVSSYRRLEGNAYEIIRELAYTAGRRDGLHDALTNTKPDIVWEKVVPRFDHYYRKH